MPKITKIEITIFILLSFLAVVFFWNSPALYPIKFFTTAIHESCHALTAILTGGKVIEINLSGRSGHAITAGGWTIFVIPAGYLGTSFIGATLVRYSRRKRMSGFLITIISGTVLYMNLTYIDSYLSSSFWLTNLIAAGLIFMAIKTNWNTRVSIFLGTFFAMASIEDARTYLLAIPYKTDAGIMARHIGAEFLTLPIALSFTVASAMIWWYSLKRVV